MELGCSASGARRPARSGAGRSPVERARAGRPHGGCPARFHTASLSPRHGRRGGCGGGRGEGCDRRCGRGVHDGCRETRPRRSRAAPRGRRGSRVRRAARGRRLAIADRVWPILLFVVAVTVVAELAARAGVFDLVAAHLARRARAAGERPGPPPMGGGGPPRHAAASRQRHPAVDAGARRRRRAHRRVRGALARNAARRTAALAARRLRVGPLPRRGRRSRRCSGTNGCARSASRCRGAATSSRASSRRP